MVYEGIVFIFLIFVLHLHHSEAPIETAQSIIASLLKSQVKDGRTDF